MPRIKKIREFNDDDANYLCGAVCKDNNDECVEDKCPLYREGECKAYLFKQLERVQNEIYHYFREEKVELK